MVRDLTNKAQNDSVLQLASELLEEYGAKVLDLDRLCSQNTFVAAADPVWLEALKCACSRLHLERSLSYLGRATRISVVWAMYKERQRLLPFAAQNPLGQDLLRRKIDQIQWLTHGLRSLEWHLIAVDDGCPEGSAEAARSVLQTLMADDLDQQGQVTISSLAEALGDAGRNRSTGLSKDFWAMRQTSESRKGGSIVYGLWIAGRSRVPACHIVVYTDADLSINLGQVGLIAAPLLLGRASTVVGQRYGLNGAILVKEAGATTEPASTAMQPDKMMILLRNDIRRQLFPSLAGLLDIQAGFKAFASKVLPPALSEMGMFRESFDVELILRTTASSTRGIKSLTVAPVLFVEDFESSNFQSHESGQHHLGMLSQLVEISERLPSSPQNDLVRFVSTLDVDSYSAVVHHLQADDRRRHREGLPDPMFKRRWSVVELEAMTESAAR